MLKVDRSCVIFRVASRLTLFLAMASCSLADLTFESTNAKVEVEADQETVEAYYHFENTGNIDFVIKKVKSVCPLCLSAQIKGGRRREDSAFVFKPGEKGTVKALFKVGAKVGSVEKSIQLYKEGDPEDAPSINLQCDVNVPVVVTVTPRTLTWKLADTYSPKKIVIKVTEGHQMKIKPPKVTNNRFLTEFTTIREGLEYAFMVTPKKEAKLGIAVCYFYTDSPNPKYRKIRAYLKVSK